MASSPSPSYKEVSTAAEETKDGELTRQSSTRKRGFSLGMGRPNLSLDFLNRNSKTEADEDGDEAGLLAEDLRLPRYAFDLASGKHTEHSSLSRMNIWRSDVPDDEIRPAVRTNHIASAFMFQGNFVDAMAQCYVPGRTGKYLHIKGKDGQSYRTRPVIFETKHPYSSEDSHFWWIPLGSTAVEAGGVDLYFDRRCRTDKMDKLSIFLLDDVKHIKVLAVEPERQGSVLPRKSVLTSDTAMPDACISVSKLKTEKVQKLIAKKKPLYEFSGSMTWPSAQDPVSLQFPSDAKNPRIIVRFDIADQVSSKDWGVRIAFLPHSVDVPGVVRLFRTTGQPDGKEEGRIYSTGRPDMKMSGLGNEDRAQMKLPTDMAGEEMGPSIELGSDEEVSHQRQQLGRNLFLATRERTTLVVNGANMGAVYPGAIAHFEVLIIKGQSLRIGWAARDGVDRDGLRVAGETEYSWAMDKLGPFYIRRKYHGTQIDQVFGRWKKGDIVGVTADLRDSKNMRIIYSTNGANFEEAWSGIDKKFTLGGLIPTVTTDDDSVCMFRINVGGFRFENPMLKDLDLQMTPPDSPSKRLLRSGSKALLPSPNLSTDLSQRSQLVPGVAPDAALESVVVWSSSSQQGHNTPSPWLIGLRERSNSRDSLSSGELLEPSDESEGLLPRWIESGYKSADGLEEVRCLPINRRKFRGQALTKSLLYLCHADRIEAFTLDGTAVVDGTPAYRFLPNDVELRQDAVAAEEAPLETELPASEEFRGIVTSPGRQSEVQEDIAEHVVLFTRHRVWVYEEQSMGGTVHLTLQWTQRAPAYHEIKEVRVDQDIIAVRIGPEGGDMGRDKLHSFNGLEELGRESLSLGGRESLSKVREDVNTGRYGFITILKLLSPEKAESRVRIPVGRFTREVQLSKDHVHALFSASNSKVNKWTTHVRHGNLGYLFQQAERARQQLELAKRMSEVDEDWGPIVAYDEIETLEEDCFAVWFRDMSAYAYPSSKPQRTVGAGSTDAVEPLEDNLVILDVKNASGTQLFAQYQLQVKLSSGVFTELDWIVIGSVVIKKNILQWAVQHSIKQGWDILPSQLLELVRITVHSGCGVNAGRGWLRSMFGPNQQEPGACIRRVTDILDNSWTELAGRTLSASAKMDLARLIYETANDSYLLEGLEKHHTLNETMGLLNTTFFEMTLEYIWNEGNLFGMYIVEGLLHVALGASFSRFTYLVIADQEISPMWAVIVSILAVYPLLRVWFSMTNTLEAESQRQDQRHWWDPFVDSGGNPLLIKRTHSISKEKESRESRTSRFTQRKGDPKMPAATKQLVAPGEENEQAYTIRRAWDMRQEIWTEYFLPLLIVILTPFILTFQILGMLLQIMARTCRDYAEAQGYRRCMQCLNRTLLSSTAIGMCGEATKFISIWRHTRERLGAARGQLYRGRKLQKFALYLVTLCWFAFAQAFLYAINYTTTAFYVRAAFGLWTSFIVHQIQAASWRKEVFNAINLLAWIVPAYAMLICVTNEDQLSTRTQTWVAIGVLFLWLKLLGILRGLGPKFAAFVLMLKMIVGDLGEFSVVMAVFLAAFAQAFYFLLQRDDMDEDDAIESYSAVTTTWLEVFAMMLGEFSYDVFVPTIGPTLLFLCFMLVVSVVMLNVLIAIISDSYNEAMVQKSELYHSAQFSLIMELQPVEEFLRGLSRRFPILKVLFSTKESTDNLFKIKDKIDEKMADFEADGLFSATGANRGNTTAVQLAKVLRDTKLVELVKRLDTRVSELGSSMPIRGEGSFAPESKEHRGRTKLRVEATRVRNALQLRPPPRAPGPVSPGSKGLGSPEPEPMRQTMRAESVSRSPTRKSGSGSGESPAQEPSDLDRSI